MGRASSCSFVIATKMRRWSSIKKSFERTSFATASNCELSSRMAPSTARSASGLFGSGKSGNWLGAGIGELAHLFKTSIAQLGRDVHHRLHETFRQSPSPSRQGFSQSFHRCFLFRGTAVLALLAWFSNDDYYVGRIYWALESGSWSACCKKLRGRVARKFVIAAPAAALYWRGKVQRSPAQGVNRFLYFSPRDVEKITAHREFRARPHISETSSGSSCLNFSHAGRSVHNGTIPRISVNFRAAEARTKILHLVVFVTATFQISHQFGFAGGSAAWPGAR